MAVSLFSPSRRETQLRRQVAHLQGKLNQRISSPLIQDAQTFVGFGDSSNAKATLEAVSGAAATAIRVIRQRIQGLELGVFTRRFINDDFQDTPAFSHPLQALLTNPTRDPEGRSTHSAQQLFGLVVTQYEAVGEAYLVVQHDGAGIPRRLQVAVPGTLEPKLEGGVITGYRVFDSGGSGQRKLRPEDVVRIWEPDPFDLYASRGIMGKSVDIIETDQFAVKRWSKFYKNDASPKLAFVTSDMNAEYPSKEDQEEHARTWTQRFNRIFGKLTGRPAWVLPGWSVQQLTSEDEAASGVTFMTAARRKVFEQFGVPTALVGDVVDVNRSAAETTRFTFDQNTVEPLTIIIAASLTEQLASQYPSPNENIQLIVKYRPFVARDKAFELQRDQIDLQTKTRSVNEVRAAREPELPAASWGDRPVGTFSDTPYTGEEEDIDLSALGLDTTPDEEAAVEIEEEQAEQDAEEPRARAVAMGNLRAHFTPEQEWARTIVRDERFTPKFRALQRSIFFRQAEITLERFVKFDGSVRSQRCGRTERAHADDVAEEIFPLNGWQSMFEATTEPVRRASFISSATEATDAITGRRFRMTAEAIAALGEMDLVHYVAVNTTTQEALKEALRVGLADGESTSQIAARIGEVFGTRRAQSTRIARTEIASAVQTAQVEGYRQTGVVEKKQWNTSRDGAVRDSHIIEGQTRDLDEPFSLGNGAQAQGPADASLSAGDRVNCRCFVTPVFIDEDLTGVL